MGLQVESYGKSSVSTGSSHYIEVGAWKKSSASMAGGHCVEVTSDGHVVRVRDTKEVRRVGDSALTLAFGLKDWQHLVDLQKQGEGPAEAAVAGTPFTMELEDGGVFEQVPAGNGDHLWVNRPAPKDTALRFTLGEVSAWGAGVPGGEFDLPPELQALVAA